MKIRLNLGRFINDTITVSSLDTATKKIKNIIENYNVKCWSEDKIKKIDFTVLGNYTYNGTIDTSKPFYNILLNIRNGVNGMVEDGVINHKTRLEIFEEYGVILFCTPVEKEKIWEKHDYIVKHNKGKWAFDIINKAENKYKYKIAKKISVDSFLNDRDISEFNLIVLNACIIDVKL